MITPYQTQYFAWQLIRCLSSGTLTARVFRLPMKWGWAKLLRQGWSLSRTEPSVSVGFPASCRPQSAAAMTLSTRCLLCPLLARTSTSTAISGTIEQYRMTESQLTRILGRSKDAINSPYYRCRYVYTSKRSS